MIPEQELYHLPPYQNLLVYKYENNSGKNMPECNLRDNLARIAKVIYFTESFLNLNIQSF